MPTGQTSIRLDSELLRAVDDLAKQRGASRTDIMEQALRAFLRTGGEHTIAGAMLPAGFTPAFETWLTSVSESTGASMAAILALDVRVQVPVVYVGLLHPFAAKQARDSGMVRLQLYDESDPTSQFVAPIPRGLILGWETQEVEFARNRLILFWGATDGNTLVRALRHPFGG